MDLHLTTEPTSARSTAVSRDQTVSLRLQAPADH